MLNDVATSAKADTFFSRFVRWLLYLPVLVGLIR